MIRGRSIGRVTLTASRSAPRATANSNVADALSEARAENRTRAEPLAGTATVPRVSSRAAPIAFAVTTAVPAWSVRLWMTMPTEAASPERRNRGRAGCAISGLFTVSRVSPAPNWSARSAATAMSRNAVRLSGATNENAISPLSSVTSIGAQ